MLPPLSCDTSSHFLNILVLFPRGVQLTNPFYSIWATDVGTELAVSFIPIFKGKIIFKKKPRLVLICRVFIHAVLFSSLV